MITIEIIAESGAKIGSTWYPCGQLVTTDTDRADRAVSNGVAIYAEYSTFTAPKKAKK